MLHTDVSQQQPGRGGGKFSNIVKKAFTWKTLAFFRAEERGSSPNVHARSGFGVARKGGPGASLRKENPKAGPAVGTWERQILLCEGGTHRPFLIGEEENGGVFS